MKRRKISPGDRVELTMNAQERDLLLEHTFMDPEYAERLRTVAGKKVAGKRDLVGDYTLDDLEDMLGYIAAHASHGRGRVERVGVGAVQDHGLELPPPFATELEGVARAMARKGPIAA